MMIRLWIWTAITVILGQCAELPQMDTQTIDVPISAAKPNDKLKLKYLTTEAFVKNEDKSKAPILMHLTFGDTVENVLNKEQFVYDLAEQMGALLAVVEHRLYGASQIPNDPSPTTAPKLDTYLQPDDILNDFTTVINKLKENREGIFVISGSGHAAVLATLLRKKDQTINGAIISNGALKLFKGGISNLGEFDSFLNSIYKNEGCPMDRLTAAFDALMNADLKDSKDRAAIHAGLDLIGTEQGITSGFAALITYIHRAYEDLVLENLDVPHTVGEREFDSRPVKKVCDQIAALTIGNTLADKLKPIYFILNASYQTEHQNYLITKWPRKDVTAEFTRCSYFAPYHCSVGGNSDYFAESLYTCETEVNKPPSSDNWVSATQNFCENILTDMTDEYLNSNVDYIGSQTNNFNFDDIKKIIFIDGAEDPNSIGAVQTVKAENEQYKFTIPKTTKAAHLLQPSSCDSVTMKQLRYRISKIVQCWSGVITDTNQCSQSRLQGGNLPNYVSNVSGDCQPTVLAFPWGQKEQEEPDGPTDDPTGNPRATTVPSSASSVTKSFILIIFSHFILTMIT